MFKKLALALCSLTLMFTFAGCAEGADDSEIVNHNLTKAAQNFEIQRRIVVMNGITDKIVMQVEGRCDVSPGDGKVFFTCKVSEGAGPQSYIRNQVYVGDNVIISVEQGEPVKASAYHYRFTYKPQSIIPDPDFRGSMSDTPLAAENQQ